MPKIVSGRIVSVRIVQSQQHFFISKYSILLTTRDLLKICDPNQSFFS